MVYNVSGSSWKDEIISDPPGDDLSGIEEQSDIIKDLKHRIVTLVEVQGVNRRDHIASVVDYPSHFVEQCIDDLKSEGVLKVVSNA